MTDNECTKKKISSKPKIKTNAKNRRKRPVRKDSQRLKAIIADMTLLDNALMALVFDGNIPATELLLKIILEMNDLKVIIAKGQHEFRNATIGGRIVRIDILAKDSTGRQFNVEVQRDNAGADCHRARFHSSVLDTRMLKAGQDFKELRDSYVIFITENDVIGNGLPVYRIERVIQETASLFGDGSHIIYVNGSYHGDDPIGKLMHDFRCANPDDMNFRQLASGVKYFKGNEGDVRMSTPFDEYVDELIKEELAEQKKKIEVQKKKADAQKKKAEAASKKASAAEASQADMVKNLMETMKWTKEQAFDAMKVPQKKRAEISKRMQKA